MLRKMDVDRVIGGMLLLAMHEVDGIGRQGQLLQRSWPQLRSARSAGALRCWRRQLWLQMRQSHSEDCLIRRELWQGLRQDFRGS